MNVLFPNAIVITGGPCTGKTTLLQAMASLGYSILPEMARTIIEESEIKGRDLVPWKSLADFQEEVLRRQLEQESVMGESRRVHFLDRGIVDGAGYCMEGGICEPKTLLTCGYCRYGKVVLLEPLSHYTQDISRMEDRDRGVRIHECIIGAYEKYSYTIERLPAWSIERRVERLQEIAESLVP